MTKTTKKAAKKSLAQKKTGPNINLADKGFQNEFTNYNRGQQRYLSINLSDLKLKLRDFKKAVKSTDLLIPLVGVIGIWVPLFTSDFKSILNMKPEEVRGVYFAFVFLLSVVLLRNICRNFSQWFHRHKSKDIKKAIKYESDSDSLADMLCEVDEQRRKQEDEQ